MSFIHSTSEVQTTNIGKNICVWQFCVILANAKIGNNCKIGCNVFIENNVKIGNNVTIYPDVMLFGDGPISIGNNVTIGNGTIIYASKNAGVSIGDCTLIAAHCYIIDMDHGIEAGQLIRKQSNTTSKVFIGKDCWLGANVSVLKGSYINDGAVIGANSLVKGEVPTNSICVGSPCKEIKHRGICGE